MREKPNKKKYRENEEQTGKPKTSFLKKAFPLVFLLAVIFIPRFYTLFFVTDPQNAGAGWYGDTYHHWQIGYLTKTTGWKQGFFRLWDLKGMEYFWGIVHPLLLAVLISITGSTSIVLTRLLSMTLGGLSILVLFVLVKRYWGTKVAWGAVLLAALNPVGIFNDVSGMVEPVAIFFLLSGLVFWPKRPILTGLSWSLASMARGEAWLFSIGLIIALILFEKRKNQPKELLAISYFVMIGLYMKCLLDYTGNAIYPLWWNFLGNAVGRWQADIPLRPDQQTAQIIFIAIFVVSALGIVFTLKKKPQGWLLLLLGLGNFFFLGGFVGLTAYVKSYVHYFWVVRIFILPYMVLGVVISILFLKTIPEALSFVKKIKLDWLAIFVILAVSQLGWLVIWHYYQKTIPIWAKEVKLAKQVSSHYEGGKALIPEVDPQFTYGLVYFGHIKGENIAGQMFDPFFYMKGDPFENWGKNREILLDWLKSNDFNLMVIDRDKKDYWALIKKEPAWFEYLDRNDDFNLSFFRIKL